MLVTKLRMDGQMFYLPADIDTTVLKEQIISAAKDGAAFVEFETLGHGQVSVLMTPHIPVRFETVERSEEEVAGWEIEPPTFDYDATSYID